MRPERAVLVAVVALVLLVPLTLVSCSPRSLFPYRAMPGPPHPPIPGVDMPADVAAEPPVPTQAEFRNVDFRFDEDLVLRIRHLRGRMRGKADGPVVFDDPDSFTMEIEDAQTSMGARDMTSLMRRYVFGYDGAPIRELQVVPQADGLRQTGVLHKVIDIPFEMLAEVSVSEDGWIRIHPVEMKICDLPGLGLMKALGIELDDLIDLKGAPPGIRVVENDMLLDPLAVLPPPKTRGRLRAVRAVPGEMQLDIGPADGAAAPGVSAAPPTPIPDAPNYMFFWEGILHFGKLFMPESDMMVVDESPQDPFDFYLDQYNDQLVAGFTHNGPDYGLEVHMVDYDELAPDARGVTQAPGAAR